jgi:PBP1b-binding outer membrane lipoprotein LpoB
MFNSKKIATIIAASAFSLAGCSPAPSSAVKDFYMNVSNGDIKKAMESVDKKSLARKGVSEGKMEVAAAGASKTINASSCGGLKDVVVVSEEVRGDVAKVTVELVCNSGKKMKENGSLTKSEGAWRLTLDE